MTKREAIVCVDDEPTVLKTLARALRFGFGDDYEIEMASSGSEALEILNVLEEERTEVKVMISDALMPGMNGFELLTKVHSIYPQTVKIMITGQSDPQKVDLLRRHIQLRACLAKPWKPKDLLDVVSQALGETA